MLLGLPLLMVMYVECNLESNKCWFRINDTERREMDLWFFWCGVDALRSNEKKIKIGIR